MMTETASDFLIKRINEWGLKRIYGYPGDGINGIMGALDRANGAVGKPGTYSTTKYESGWASHS